MLLDMRWILVFGALIGSIYCKEKFNGHQVFQIKVRDGEQMNKLNELVNMENFKLNFWKLPTTPKRPVDVVVPSSSLKLVKSFLESHGLEYSISIEDLQALLDEEIKEMKHNRGKERNNGNFNYGAYHSLEELYQEMDRIASDYPNLASRQEIGRSFEKRPLYVLKFSTGKGKRPAIWLNAGIHSREWISQATGIWIARKIVSDYGNESSITSILDEMDIFLMPVANPDGYVYSQTKNRFWRKTRSRVPGIQCVGVDPNRNWNASFSGEGASNDPCSEAYHGPKPHSEIEVKSVVDFIQNHGNFKSFIDIHSYSQLLMYPYGYTCKHPRDFAELDQVAHRAAKALASLYGTSYRVGPICSTIYMASGSSIDWAYENGIKYAFTFELRDTGHYGFLLPAQQILPTAEETWLALKVIMKHVHHHLY
ncbi:carboxypeptidase A4 isoform X1 [Monodelphis domestica]|uniref:carboxypeptidase A4 isoform X1 n=2 Tax=Monodelphis domestica TaxID=13616 RepID=UPI0024E22C3E|nr:carboxypeptidase A4 isoform X1 [Monodelphis domestica]